MGDRTADDAAGKQLEITAFSAVEGLDIPTGGAGNETLVIDPLALSGGLTLVEVIADYAEGQDVLDLSDLLTSLGTLPPADAEAVTADNVLTSASAAAHVDSDAAAAGGFVDVASLTGVHTTIAILYDDTKPVHSETVT